MNTNIELFKHLEAVSAPYSKGKCSYNTNFDLFAKDGSLTYSYRRQSCFAEIFIKDSEFLKTNKDEEAKLVIYFLQEDTRLSKTEIYTYIKYLKSLGIPFVFKESPDFDLNYLCYNASKDDNIFFKGCQSGYESVDVRPYTHKLSDLSKLLCYKKQTVYSMEIDLHKVNSLLKVKLLSSYFRYMYELDHDYILKQSLKYKRKNKHISIFQILNINMHTMLYDRIPKSLTVYKLEDPQVRQGHIMFTEILIGLTSKRLKQVIKHLENLRSKNELQETQKYFDNLKFVYQNGWGNKKCSITQSLVSNIKFSNYIKKITNTTVKKSLFKKHDYLFNQYSKFKFLLEYTEAKPLPSC